MRHQRKADGTKGASRQLPPVRCGSGRELRAAHVRDVDADLLKQSAIGQHAALPAATFRALPGILAEMPASILSLERGAEAILQLV